MHASGDFLPSTAFVDLFITERRLELGSFCAAVPNSEMLF
jgi:hypothetical protein